MRLSVKNMCVSVDREKRDDDTTRTTEWREHRMCVVCVSVSEGKKRKQKKEREGKDCCWC